MGLPAVGCGSAFSRCFVVSAWHLFYLLVLFKVSSTAVPLSGKEAVGRNVQRCCRATLNDCGFVQEQVTEATGLLSCKALLDHPEWRPLILSCCSKFRKCNKCLSSPLPVGSVGASSVVQAWFGLTKCWRKEVCFSFWDKYLSSSAVSRCLCSNHDTRNFPFLRTVLPKSQRSELL